MNRSLAKKALVYFGALVAIGYFLGAAGVDPDLWGHLEFGRRIIDSHQIPRFDIYSFTAGHTPWIDHEWLAEVIMSVIFQRGGTPGLILFRLLSGCSLFILLAATVFREAGEPGRRTPPAVYYLWVVIFWVAAPLIAQGFALRPQVFSYLLGGVFLFLLGRAARGRSGALPALIPLMILWVNLHGGFLMGLFMIFIFSFFSLKKKKSGNHPSVLVVWGIFILALLATVVNPYGIGLWKFLLRSLSEPRLQIAEWRPFSPDQIFFYRFTALIIFTLIAAVVSGKSVRSLYFWLFAGLSLAAYLQRRHSPFAVMAAVPVAASSLPVILRRLRSRGFTLSLFLSRFLKAGVVLLIAAQAVMLILTLRREGGKIRINPDHYPVRAAAFMKANGIGGNLVTLFEWGEYCIYHLYPSCRVAFDGRFRTVYPPELIRSYWEFDRGGSARLLSRYPATAALLERAIWGCRYLERNPDWVKIFEDNRSVLFLKKTAGNTELLKQRLKPANLKKPFYFP